MSRKNKITSVDIFSILHGTGSIYQSVGVYRDILRQYTPSVYSVQRLSAVICRMCKDEEAELLPFCAKRNVGWKAYIK